MKDFKKYLLLGLPVILVACNDDSDSNPPSPTSTPVPIESSFEVSITNLTANQPLSPAFVSIHSAGWRAFSIRDEASDALEQLAESGNNNALIELANSDVLTQSAVSGNGIIPPGGSENIIVTVNGESMTDSHELTFVSMPVNTNDGLVAVLNASLSDLDIGDSKVIHALSYDAGTEANTESSQTVPGMGGEGFNADRDDIRNAIHLHAGVVTQDEGLTTSSLNSTHKWDNPMVSITISRIQ